MFATLKRIKKLRKLFRPALEYWEAVLKYNGLWSHSENELALLRAAARTLELQKETAEVLREMRVLQSTVAAQSGTLQKQHSRILHTLGHVCHSLDWQDDGPKAIQALRTGMLKLQEQIECLQGRRRTMPDENITSDYVRHNPELRLMAYLYPDLPNHTAIDVGANIGDVSEHLLNSGYEVYAIEPFTPTFERLSVRLGRREGFHGIQAALGPADGTGVLHLVEDISAGKTHADESVYPSLVLHSMPSDLVFSGKAEVTVRSLESLHLASQIPADASLVKIDTEGYDIEVIRGMGEHFYPVVITEFWDPEHTFGKTGAQNRLGDLVRIMSDRGYAWHVVLFRVEGSNDVRFLCNCTHVPPTSWGNVFFFRDEHLFEKSSLWCSNCLEPYNISAPSRPVVSRD